MTPLAIVALVLGILLVVVAVLAAVLIPTLRRLKRRSEEQLTEVRAEAEASGETVLAGPEPASYRGGTGSHSALKGNGTILLTDQRLAFRMLVGGDIDIARSAITGVREETTFLGARVGGQVCLVIETSEPAELGFFVQDRDRWRALLAPSDPA